MEYTAHNLEYAVTVFYNGNDEDRSKAHTWLSAAQRVPEAWNFVWELLQSNKGTEVQFYAATTLHTKILRCWNEVPEESYTELKEKLLQAMMAYSNGPKIVTNRLCISLAAFILQQGSTDIADILRPLSTTATTSLLLEVLTVIPEEFNSMTMGTALRARNRAALNQACSMVLDDMLRYLQDVFNDYSNAPPSEASIQLWTSAASCASNWLALSEDTLDSTTTLPERAPLCRALYTAVRLLCTWNEAVSGSALEACEAFLSTLRAAGTAGGAARHPASARSLLTDLATLAEPLLAAHNQPNSMNEELLAALIICCVAVAECHARVLVEAVEEGREGKEEEGGAGDGGGARRILQVLLAAQAAPGHYPLHETRSNLVFGLWYTLQDQILNMSDSTNKVSPVWYEVFTQLLITLIKKSEMPPESMLSRDEQELLRCYRQDIADIVMYCYSILGENCWSLVESAFTGAESARQREAALHVFAALADAAPAGRAPTALPALLQHALRLAADPTNNDTRLLHTALDCLGFYASWLSSMEGPQGTELGRECMRAAGAALQRCPAPAALALRKLCLDCAAPAAELVADIVQLAQSVETTSEGWTRRQLVSAAGAALAVSDPERAAPLLASLAHRLHDLLTAQAQSAASARSSAGGAAECVSLMCALSARPALAAELFRILRPALALLPANQDLTQAMFQILKHTVSALMGDCINVIEDIAVLIIAGFESQPCPVGLDVIKLVAVMVGSEWEGTAGVVRAGVVSSARAVAPQTSMHALDPQYLLTVEHTTGHPCPELAEALFVLLDALTKKQPRAIEWIEDILPDLIALACEFVRAWEARAASAACSWLGSLAAVRPACLEPRAPLLTHTALRCIGGATPRNQMEPLTKLLLALNRASWPSQSAGAGGPLGDWLRASLSAPGFPTVHSTEAHKQKFIAAVLREKTSKRRLLEAVQEFSLGCRGLIGTEYARQTLSAKQMV
ncbi:unnamed protein product [Danaus chrysippus]|uniref:(African queen) hypothetical protein n=1 Tax=Danaus chrysippus TaxID=151541 RepID=A0A8J2QD71_9NEOP|nr:unnamed protein product [Danaus chrysippus]